MKSKILFAFTVASVFATLPLPTSFAQEMAKPTTEMQAVLDKLAALGAKPFSTLSVPEARIKQVLRMRPMRFNGTNASRPTLKPRSPPKIS